MWACTPPTKFKIILRRRQLCFFSGRVEQLRRLGHLFVAEAGHKMIIDHSYGLHEGITDGGTHEIEATLPQVFADRGGLRAFRRKSFAGTECVHARTAIDESPDIAVKAAKLFLDLEKGLCIGDACLNFQTVAHDTFIGEKFPDLRLAELCDDCRIELGKGLTVCLALPQDG